jgi:polysaccharide export outer membrane protein
VRANRLSVIALSALLAASCSSGGASRYRSGPGAATGPATPPQAAQSGASYAARPAQAVQFRFDVGDEIAMSVWKEPDLTSQQRLLADGTISPPLLKPTRILGMSVEEVQAKLTEAYKEYLKEPKISVRVVNIYSDRVFVLGEVKTPQAVSLVGPTTVVQAIAMAGGFDEVTAEKSNVLVIRKGPDGQPLAESVNAKAVLCGGMLDQPLHRGDIVYIPARGVTNWSRTVGQALSPLGEALGTASSVAALVVAMKK